MAFNNALLSMMNEGRAKSGLYSGQGEIPYLADPGRCGWFRLEDGNVGFGLVIYSHTAFDLCFQFFSHLFFA